MNKYTQQTVAQMEKILRSSATEGLSREAVQHLQAKLGKNLVFPKTNASFWAFLVLPACKISTYVMILALVAAFMLMPWQTALIATVAYVVFLLCLYFLYRYRQKQKKMLYRLSSARVCVIRDGVKTLISPDELVIGDLMVLRAGDVLYAEAYITSESEMDVFCKREEGREAHIKHGGPCFQSFGEPFNMLCPGDVIRIGEGRAFVTGTSRTAPKADNVRSETEKKQRKVTRLGVLFSALILCLSVLVSYLVKGDAEDFMPFLLCAALVFAISPCAWGNLLYECIFLFANRKMRIKTHAAFTSLSAVEAAAEGNCFLFSTRSVFQGARFVVRSFESGTGIHISEKSKKNTPELSLIASALWAIHKKNPATSYEKYLLSFCQGRKDDALGLKLNGSITSPKGLEASIASFSASGEGRSFSFVAGDPKELLSYALYISENGRVRLLDKQTRAAILASAEKMKKDGHSVIAYAETQTRFADGDAPLLAADLKILGLFVMSELPDRRISDTIRFMAENGKKGFFFHDGEDPTWITDALPILRSAPIIDGHEINFQEELTAFSTDPNLPFAIGVHFTPQQKAKLAHMLAENGYVTVSYGASYEDHRLMCASAISIASFGEEECVGIVQESADLYAREHIGSGVGALRTAENILRSFDVTSHYFCASMLARSILLLFGAVFGWVLLDVLPLSVLSLFDLLAFGCLCRVRTKHEDSGEEDHDHTKGKGLFVGVISATAFVGVLSLWMAAMPKDFRFSYAVFCFASLLTILNVGVLRFASVRYSASLLLFPLASLGVTLSFMLLEGYLTKYAWIVPEFPFWVLLPTVVLVAVGRAFEYTEQKRHKGEK